MPQPAHAHAPARACTCPSQGMGLGRAGSRGEPFFLPLRPGSAPPSLVPSKLRWTSNARSCSFEMVKVLLLALHAICSSQIHTKALGVEVARAACSASCMRC